jgi:energy-coupling factor transporter transmembrane protein EcfT
VRLVPTYERRPSSLHTARASVTTLYCLAFATAAVLISNPIVLAGIACGVLAAGNAAGVGRRHRYWLWVSLPFGVAVVVINALVSQRGLTVVFRGGTLPGGHRLDVTAESLAWGGVSALRLTCLFLAFGLHALVVDPDELLRGLRRVSYRSALTGSLATRLVPVLARDATRMSDASRCRPRPPGRLEVTRAALAGALERAVEVAAALEVRGYAAARPPRRSRRVWSRHDLRVATGTALIAGATAAGLAANVVWLDSEPVVRLATGPATIAVAAVFVVAGALPFAGSSARLGVARA